MRLSILRRGYILSEYRAAHYICEDRGFMATNTTNTTTIRAQERVLATNKDRKSVV